MLSARQRRIIEALQKEQGALTGTELAKLLAVSSRTVRTDIPAVLENIFRKFSCIIMFGDIF